MWIMWIMWKVTMEDKIMCNQRKMAKYTYIIAKNYEIIDKYTYVNQFMQYKNPHAIRHIKMCINMWIMWITYLPRSCSPIFTTSPAPIVINRSPCVQFSNKKFSISSKVGKYSHGVPSSDDYFLQICWKKCQDYPFLCAA